MHKKLAYSFPTFFSFVCITFVKRNGSFYVALSRCHYNQQLQHTSHNTTHHLLYRQTYWLYEKVCIQLILLCNVCRYTTYVIRNIPTYTCYLHFILTFSTLKSYIFLQSFYSRLRYIPYPVLSVSFKEMSSLSHFIIIYDLCVCMEKGSDY